MEHGDYARRSLTGWGRTAPTTALVGRPKSVEDVVSAVVSASGRGVIARGLGRSYGDPAQNAGGVVLDMTGLDRIHQVDADTGLVALDAGVSLDTLMRGALPHGLWVPVLPGTRQVTIGGAIGADMHGKNHHTKGSFGNHVLSMDLVTADGQVRTLTPDGPESELFWATVGGMGLTGVIVRATIQLHHTETAYFVVDTDRTADLDETAGAAHRRLGHLRLLGGLVRHDDHRRPSSAARCSPAARWPRPTSCPRSCATTR